VTFSLLLNVGAILVCSFQLLFDCTRVFSFVIVTSLFWLLFGSENYRFQESLKSSSKADFTRFLCSDFVRGEQ